MNVFCASSPACFSLPVFTLTPSRLLGICFSVQEKCGGGDPEGYRVSLNRPTRFKKDTNDDEGFTVAAGFASYREPTLSTNGFTSSFSFFHASPVGPKIG